MNEAPKSRLVSFVQSSRSAWLIGVLIIVDAALVSFCNSDIISAWPVGDRPKIEWKINWPASIFWFCLFWLVLLVCFKAVIFLKSVIHKGRAVKTKRPGERTRKALAILRHVWTVALFVGGSILLVVLPYRAIVEWKPLFWVVVCAGLVVAFICSASELAFATACGVNKESKVYEDNLEERKRLRAIFDDPNSSKQDSADAAKKAKKLELLIRIGEDYSSRHNPTLVVANNVANMLVAVVSTVAIFEHPDANGVGQPCSWGLSQSGNSVAVWLVQHLSLRCANLGGGAWLPFPVNAQIFQTAFALTLILIIGEMLPKQLATAFPRRMCFPKLYRFVGFVFGLGVGPSFGAFSEIILSKLKDRLQD